MKEGLAVSDERREDEQGLMCNLLQSRHILLVIGCAENGDGGEDRGDGGDELVPVVLCKKQQKRGHQPKPSRQGEAKTPTGRT